jgi:MFS family permease
MTPRAVVGLGIGQLVNWGVLYYAFAILVQPLQRELGVATWVVTGAFSLALLMSALLAPTVGRWCDRDRGAVVIQAGGITAAAVLVAWTLIPGVVMLYAVWAALGFCMAATLYEPAFVVVGRAYDDPTRRLRALAAVTLFGGLASTVFLPGTASLVAAFGWRGAVLVLAALLLLSTGLTYTLVFRRMPARPLGFGVASSATRVPDAGTEPGRFLFVVASFALASLSSAGFAANLVPALGERGASTASAAMLGGLMGGMQLPGRAMLMNGALAGSPARLVAVSLLLHGLGLAAVAFAPSMLVLALGTMTFALGAGLTTLVRPHLIQSMFRSASGGYLNGRLARYQQLARAVGPLGIAWLGSVVGYAAAFALFAGAFTVFALLSPGVLSGIRRVPRLRPFRPTGVVGDERRRYGRFDIS